MFFGVDYAYGDLPPILYFGDQAGITRLSEPSVSCSSPVPSA
jgi:hypothetical protein